MEIINSDERLVAGWANVEVVDMQGEIIPIDLLKEAMLKYMDLGGPVVLAHTNKQVGKVLQWEIKEHPETKTPALWIVAKIDKIYPTHDEVWQMVKEGKFKGFSVGGRGVRKVVKLKPEFRGKGLPEEVKVLSNLELFEISLAPTPANPYARIEAVSLAKMANDVTKDKLTLDDILRKYKISKKEYEESKECILCKIVKKVFDDCGDLDVAMRVGMALLKKRMEKMRKIGELENFVKNIKKKLNDPPSEDEKEKYERLIEAVEGKISKLLNEVRKPFGDWESFDDCVNDMKSKGYDEESAKRICGSLQSRLEKVDNYDDVEELLECISDALEIVDEIGDGRFEAVRESLLEIQDFIYDAILDDVGEEGIDDEEMVGEDVVESIKSLVEIDVLKDKRPPKSWFYRCVERTGRPALCGWVFYHHLKPKKPKSKKEPDKPHTAEARRRKREWLGT